MSSTKPVVIVTRKLPEATEARMQELFDTRLNDDDAPMSNADLMAAMQSADVLVPTVTDYISADLIAQAGERLKLIANYGNGVDNIDLPAARERGISVTNTPGVLTEDTADMTMALLLAVPRRISEGARLLHSGDWKGWSPTLLPGRRIWGKQLGIVGMGRIGTALARRARDSGWKSTITTVVRSTRMLRMSLRPPIGNPSIRCFRAWISFRSIAPGPRRPFTCSPAAGWS